MVVCVIVWCGVRGVAVNCGIVGGVVVVAAVYIVVGVVANVGHVDVVGAVVGGVVVV